MRRYPHRTFRNGSTFRPQYDCQSARNICDPRLRRFDHQPRLQLHPHLLEENKRNGVSCPQHGLPDHETLAERMTLQVEGWKGPGSRRDKKTGGLECRGWTSARAVRRSVSKRARDIRLLARLRRCKNTFEEGRRRQHSGKGTGQRSMRVGI